MTTGTYAARHDPGPWFEGFSITELETELEALSTLSHHEVPSPIIPTSALWARHEIEQLRKTRNQLQTTLDTVVAALVNCSDGAPASVITAIRDRINNDLTTLGPILAEGNPECGTCSGHCGYWTAASKPNPDPNLANVAWTRCPDCATT